MSLIHEIPLDKSGEFVNSEDIAIKLVLIREAFKKNDDETYGKFHILGGGSAGGHFPYVITKDFKCTESHFEHF